MRSFFPFLTLLVAVLGATKKKASPKGLSEGKGTPSKKSSPNTTTSSSESTSTSSSSSSKDPENAGGIHLDYVHIHGTSESKSDYGLIPQMDVNPQNLMLCRDGIMKEVNVDPNLPWNEQDWQFADVCEDHGGRLNCPHSIPYKCNSDVCGVDGDEICCVFDYDKDCGRCCGQKMDGYCDNSSGSGKDVLNPSSLCGKKDNVLGAPQQWCMNSTLTGTYAMCDCYFVYSFDQVDCTEPCGTASPTTSPSKSPTKAPTTPPTTAPSHLPSNLPTANPTNLETQAPSETRFTSSPSEAPLPCPGITSAGDVYTTNVDLGIKFAECCQQLVSGGILLDDCDTNKWDVSGVTDFTGALSSLTDPECNNVPVDCWDVSSGTIFENMFKDFLSFDQNLDKWNTKSGTDFSGMFSGTSVDASTLASWDTKNGVTFNNFLCNVPTASRGVLCASGNDATKWQVSQYCELNSDSTVCVNPLWYDDVSECPTDVTDTVLCNSG